LDLAARPLELVDHPGRRVGVAVDRHRELGRGRDVGFAPRGVGILLDDELAGLLLALDRELDRVGARRGERGVSDRRDALLADPAVVLAPETLLVPDARVPGGRGSKAHRLRRLVAQVPGDPVEPLRVRALERPDLLARGVEDRYLDRALLLGLRGLGALGGFF